MNSTVLIALVDRLINIEPLMPSGSGEFFTSRLLKAASNWGSCSFVGALIVLLMFCNQIWAIISCEVKICHVYNNNCSFVILICLQPFCKPHLYIYKYIIRQILPTVILKHATATLHKTDWITTDCRLLCLALLYAQIFS